MDNNLIIEKTKAYVKSKMLGEGSGHDWWHVHRVWKNAINIAKCEECDNFVVELAALLHDIDDWKFNGGDETKGAKIAEKFLKDLGVDSEVINKVSYIISSLSFKGANVINNMKTIEGEIVQDADRLDAIGAIGIGRAFAYGGFKGQEMYNPNIKWKLHDSFDEYKNNKATTINHFYEKLLLLKNRMNTETAKKIAFKRHEIMESFLDEFFIEWEGEA